MSFKMKGSPMKRNFGVGDSPAKQTNTSIPSFRDFVSLEQQQAYADKLDKRRADERKYKEEIEDTLDTEGKSLKRNLFGKLTGDFFGGRRSRERADLIEKLKNEEENQEEVVEEENIVEDDFVTQEDFGGHDEKNLVNIEGPAHNLIWTDPDYYKNMSNIVNEETIDEETVDYSDATKNEMYDLRRPYKDDGTWDPDNNPEHAKIQNKINELHGSTKVYPTE